MASLQCTRKTCLRAVAQPIRVITAPRAPTASFTSSARPLKQQTISHEPFRSVSPTAARILATRFFQPSAQVTRRHASTATGPNATEEILTWDRFFDLRKKKRYMNLGWSFVTSTVVFVATTPLITEYEVDAYLAQISGLDPFIVLGMTAFAVAIGGGMCGPTFGNGAFKLWAGRRGLNEAIAEKEKSFYDRVNRYRGDASKSSPQNPVPDFYGEKIKSVKDYRRWLKDQRAFKRKKDRPLGF